MTMVENLSESFSGIINAAGFTWIVAVIYLALISLGIDTLRIVNYFFDIWPDFIKENYQAARKVTAAISVSVTAILLLYGYFNFNNIKTVNLEITTEKHFEPGKLRAVLISDLHLSSYIREGHLKKVIEKIELSDPDVLLIAGDITDRSLKPLKEWGLAEMLGNIKTKHGIYAISGNHEYYGGERGQIFKVLNDNGINILIDSVVTINGQIQIAGREDRTNSKRKTLNELLKDADRDMLVILLDHQPYNLDESVKEGVDVQLSGHTHRGQFWPGNLIVKSMYELAYGYMKKGNTHFYVTSGAGIWGPKIRIGSQTEIVVIDIFPGKL
jgi:predicted MPP superfamily phosphohydrolase